MATNNGDQEEYSRNIQQFWGYTHLYNATGNPAISLPLHWSKDDLPVGVQFAAAFGNVHGVYKPGNVKLTPKILKNSQEFIEKKYNTGTNPIDFVFHGGSGSTLEEIREAIGYGVIKMNIDTDLQFAFAEGIRDYMNEKIDYLRTQIGNPDGADKPNKKYYDPRGWLRKGEETFKARLIQAFKDLNCVDTL